MKNLHIRDSYKITDINEIFLLITDYYYEDRLGKNRSIMSYVYEWYAHNWLYCHNLFTEHTKDIDLNEDESILKRIVYYIIWIIGDKQ